jgi:hypothetical protein
MSDSPGSTAGAREAGRYAIRLDGHLDQRWSARFDGLTVTRQRDGTTVLQGPIAEQAALHGLLQQVRDLGLPLISVTPLEPGPPDATRPASMTPSPTTGSTR